MDRSIKNSNGIEDGGLAFDLVKPLNVLKFIYRLLVTNGGCCDISIGILKFRSMYRRRNTLAYLERKRTREREMEWGGSLSMK
jgi:hypothetical protein